MLAQQWPQDIEDEQGAMAWFRTLHAQGINFHPLDDASEYVQAATGRPAFAPGDCAAFNRLMLRCLEVCEDACELAADVLAEYISTEHARGN